MSDLAHKLSKRESRRQKEVSLQTSTWPKVWKNRYRHLVVFEENAGSRNSFFIPIGCGHDPERGGAHIRRALQKLFNSNLTYYTACTVAVTGMDTCSCEECVKLTYACKSLQVTTGAQVYLKLSGSNETALQQKLLTVKSVDSCKAILTLDVQLLLNFNTILDTYGIPFILTGRRNPRCR